MKQVKSIKTVSTQGDVTCEFCTELIAGSSSRFSQLYGTAVKSRVILKQDDFVVIPTIGQLFKGSLLILPSQHFETMAELPSSMLDSLEKLIKQLEDLTQSLGMPILFEHGARCLTNRGCGIYHAHLHLVPVPEHIDCLDVLPEVAQQGSSLRNTFSQLKDSEAYLLFRDTKGQISFLDSPEALSQNFTSQYFRRMLAQYFQLQAPWDWRQYNHPEFWLLDTLKHYGENSVSIS
jgi:diadenosine tetraphosphate (Ap4A) HIT family hydrolase